MSRRVVLWLVAAPLFAGLTAYLLATQRVLPRALAAIRSSPALSVPDEVDVGQRVEGDAITAVIPVRNDGASPLKLSEFKTNCGCAGVQRKLPSGGLAAVSTLSISPGETEELCLSYSARNSSGSPARHKVFFRTNDPSRPEVEVYVTMRVVGRLFTYPAIASLGSWLVGREVSQVIDIRDSGAPNVGALSRVECDVAGLRLRLLPPVDEEPGTVDVTLGKLIGRCEITASSAMKPGAFSGRVRVYSESQAEPAVTFVVSGEVQPPFAIAPSALLFPKRSGGQLLYEGVSHCRGPQGEPLAVDVVSAPKHLLVSVGSFPNDPSRKQVTVRFDRAAAKEALPVGVEVVRLRLRSGTQDEEIGLRVAWEGGTHAAP